MKTLWVQAERSKTGSVLTMVLPQNKCWKIGDEIDWHKIDSYMSKFFPDWIVICVSPVNPAAA